MDQAVQPILPVILIAHQAQMHHQHHQAQLQKIAKAKLTKHCLKLVTGINLPDYCWGGNSSRCNWAYIWPKNKKEVNVSQPVKWFGFWRNLNISVTFYAVMEFEMKRKLGHGKNYDRERHRKDGQDQKVLGSPIFNWGMAYLLYC